MRPRPAPSASRTAISRWRFVARASMRFATFAHAMSSTNATAREHDEHHRANVACHVLAIRLEPARPPLVRVAELGPAARAWWPRRAPAPVPP